MMVNNIWYQSGVKIAWQRIEASMKRIVNDGDINGNGGLPTHQKAASMAVAIKAAKWRDCVTCWA